jgi:hypothetical protein
MNQSAKDILRRVDAWPAEDQEELVQTAREIEARRAGVYRLNDEERAAIERGLADMRAGHFVEEETIAAIHRKARAAPV